MRVLVVSPYFSPSRTVGAKRFSYLVREFRLASWDVQVLSLDEGSVDLDASLPVHRKVTRTRTMLPYPIARTGVTSRVYMRLMERVLGVPDPQSGWIVPALGHGLSITRQARFDALIATGPPHSAFVVAGLLAVVRKIPLILDYRDPWTGYAWKERVLPMQGVQRRMEQWIVGKASAAVFVTGHMRRYFDEVFGVSSPPERWVLTNGFDSREDILPARDDELGRRIILYAGTFYGDRSIRLILDPLLDLIRAGMVVRSEVRIHVYGTVSSKDRLHVANVGGEDLVREHERLDYSEVLARMKGADVLFLPSGRDVDYALPFKVFDYLSACRPILAVAPRGSAVEELLGSVGGGRCADIDDPKAIRDALADLLMAEAATSSNENTSYLWSAVATRYIDIVERVVKDAGRRTGS